MRYHDIFKCPCGEVYTINIPVGWALEHEDEFNKAVNQHLQAKKDHAFCAWKAEVKAFLHQPIYIKVD
jgi:hypothetical protein